MDGESKNWLYRYFHLEENHTNVKTEVIAGLTTFATMAYIVAVVPAMLAEGGLPKGLRFKRRSINDGNYNGSHGSLHQQALCPRPGNGECGHIQPHSSKRVACRFP